MKPLRAMDARALLKRAGRFVLTTILPFLLLYYTYELVYRIGLTMFITWTPDGWLPGADKLVRHVSWRYLTSGAGVVVALAPLAAGLAVFAPRRAMAFALGIVALSFVILPEPKLRLFANWGSYSWFWRSGVAADLFLQVFLLPLLTWLAAQGFGRLRRRSHSPDS